MHSSYTLMLFFFCRIMVKQFPFLLLVYCFCGVTGVVCRGGRGDRTGRYGNSNNNHNFRDMDYRGYDQEEDERETDGFYALDDQPSDVLNLREYSVFSLRGDGSQDTGDEDKCGPWPPCHQPQTAPRPFLIRMEKPPTFEKLVRTGLLERPLRKDARGFTESTVPVLGNRDDNWGATGSHSDGIEFRADGQQNEERFTSDTAKRRVSCKTLHPFVTSVKVEFFGCCRCCFYTVQVLP